LTTGTPEWNKTVVAWQRYVLHKYSPAEAKKLDDAGYFARGSAQGPLGTCVAGIQANVQGQHDRDVKGDSVEQDWVYTPDQTPATPPPQAAAVAPAPILSSCNPTAFQHRANVTVGPDGCPVVAVPAQPPAPAAQAAPRPAIPPTPAAPAVTPSVTPSVSAARAAPKTIWGVCSARAPNATYFSEPFEASAGTNTQWSKKFREMLAEKYQYTATGGLVCSSGATLADVQKIAEQQRKTAPPRRPTVDTGWMFQ